VSPSHPSAAHAIRPGSWDAWRVALRPRTLWIATIPVIVACCLAWSVAGAFDLGIAAIALTAAVMMQVITNLQNDVGYTERGAERGDRTGLPRATANGWLTPAAVKRAIVASIVIAWVTALPLMLRGGWPIVLTSTSSTLAAYAYMGGPRPIAYTPYGELMAFVFFGLVAVGGTYYVQAGQLDAAAWLAGGAIGLLAAAVLLVNNYRDRAHDKGAGRHTLAIVLSAAGALRLYDALLAVPFALAVLLAWVYRSPWLALPLLAAPRAIGLARELKRSPGGVALIGILFRTVLLEVAYGALLAVGALAHGWR
jgi:1,4-dihydroxy-2-naphthoate octaprenyltransferase